jgi:hypothetical protein
LLLGVVVLDENLWKAIHTKNARERVLLKSSTIESNIRGGSKVLFSEGEAGT